MKKSLLVLVVIILIIIGISSYIFTQNKQESSKVINLDSNKIIINNFAFSEQVINIKVNDKVTWTNKDIAQHTITSDSGSELNSERLSQDQSYSHTFNTPGIYYYHCDLHLGMKGKIIVS